MLEYCHYTKQANWESNELIRNKSLLDNCKTDVSIILFSTDTIASNEKCEQTAKPRYKVVILH